MKKFIAILTVIGIFSLESCTINEVDTADNDNTIGVVLENDIPYNFNSNNNFKFNFNLPYTIYSSDTVLVYRLTGTLNGNDLWEFLPETHYFPDGTRDFSYNFDFTQNDVQIYLEGNNLGSLNTMYRLNQIFRFVIIPAKFLYTVDSNNYSEVMKTINLKESQVKNLNI